MINEHQKYPVLQCKKVSKAKTTSLKLFQQKDDSSDSIDKLTKHHLNDIQKHANPKNLSSTLNFSYLDQTTNLTHKQKSFEQIMNETKKFLAMKRKMQNQQKIKEQTKKELKNKKKTNKQQKRSKKSNKKQKSDQKKDDQEIILSELDIQRYSTEDKKIKNLIEKIEWLKNLSQKCNIISPILFRIQKQQKNDEIQDQQERGEYLLYNDKQLLLKLAEFEIQIKLMKKNFSHNINQKDKLNSFEISQLAKWEIQSKVHNKMYQNISQDQTLQKYLDRQNLQLYADQLQNQLYCIQLSEFQSYNDQDMPQT